MRKKVLIAAVAVICVAAIALFLGRHSTEGKVAKLLDLGNKYLLEQNYEQAVVAFNKVIEIDPMNVEAYIGLAETYIGMGDPEAALAILEKGYDLTNSEEILKKLDELRGITEEDVETKEGTAEKNDTIEVEGDDRWANPKIEIDVETEKVLKEVISLGNAAQYQEACQFIGKEEFIKMTDKYISVINGISIGGTINALCDGYIIYVGLSYGPGDGYGCDFICIPENGKGFIISRSYGTNPDGTAVDDWGYLTCSVANYQFNGLCNSYFAWPDSVETGEVKLKNSYYDGEMVITQTWNESVNSHISMFMYEDGYLVPYGEDGDNVIISKEISDGYEGGERWRKEDFERDRKGREGPGSANIHYEHISDKIPWE